MGRSRESIPEIEWAILGVLASVDGYRRAKTQILIHYPIARLFSIRDLCVDDVAVRLTKKRRCVNAHAYPRPGGLFRFSPPEIPDYLAPSIKCTHPLHMPNFSYVRQHLV